MIPPRYPYPARIPWWLRATVGFVAGLLVLAGLLAVFVGLATGMAITLPDPARLDSLCAALGADEGCDWTEAAHLRGLVTLAAFDDGPEARPVFAIAVVRGRTIAMPLGMMHETDMAATIDYPATSYQHLVIGTPAWPALRQLGGVPAGVPILLDARRLVPRPGVETPATGTVRVMRVRIALVVLR